MGWGGVDGHLAGLDFEFEEGFGGVIHLPIVDDASEVKEGEGLSDDSPFILDFPSACPRSDVFDQLDLTVPMAPTVVVGPTVLDIGGKERWEEEVVVLEEEEAIEGADSTSEVLEGIPSDSGVRAFLMREREGLEEVDSFF